MMPGWAGQRLALVIVSLIAREALPSVVRITPPLSLKGAIALSTPKAASSSPQYASANTIIIDHFDAGSRKVCQLMRCCEYSF
ncbi:hypothetical protein BKA66DRAFT_461582 [Pyrenochaeta sp. MPI-SDFR-AT-0127]|nr:hypothetical protein BKA66DRAFT_461582 [Pyrenochaeta sp. MPI-SDFR-AT-0127]